MSPAVCRIGDPGDHGGQIITGSSDVLTNGIGTARVGDIYDCAAHGPNPIVSGSPDVMVNGAGVARVGDVTQCGATLIAGSPDTEAN